MNDNYSLSQPVTAYGPPVMESFPNLRGLIDTLANQIDFIRATKHQLRVAATVIGTGSYETGIPPQDSLAAHIGKEISDGMTLLNALQKLVEINGSEADDVRGATSCFTQQVPHTAPAVPASSRY